MGEWLLSKAEAAVGPPQGRCVCLSLGRLPAVSTQVLFQALFQPGRRRWLGVGTNLATA